MNYELRGHHWANLLLGYQRDYTCLEDGLKGAKHPGDKELKAYTARDVVWSGRFYRGIISDPENTVTIIDGTDDRCAICSNHDSICKIFSEDDMNEHDEDLLENSPLPIKLGDPIKVAVVLEFLKENPNPAFYTY